MIGRPIVMVATAGALLLMSGCATLPRSAAAPILLIGIPDPAKLTVVVEKHPAARGSIELSMFFVAEMQSRERQLMLALKPQAFAPATAPTDAFAEALQRPDRNAVCADDSQRERARVREFG